MITTVGEWNKQLQDVADEIRNRAEKGNKILPDFYGCFRLDKPVHILVNNSTMDKTELVDKGEYYEMIFPCCGQNQKTYLNNFAWIMDDDSVFIIERPFKNRVIKTLRRLLPDHKVAGIKNDIHIDGCKIGPTCMSGTITDFTGKTPQQQNSGLIYLLRWAHPEKLDEYFANDPNHQARKSKAPIKGLSDFLDISITDFEKEIEKDID